MYLVECKKHIPTSYLDKLLRHQNLRVLVKSYVSVAQGQKNQTKLPLKDDPFCEDFLGQSLKELAHEVPYLKESLPAFSYPIHETKAKTLEDKLPLKTLHFSLKWEWTFSNFDKYTQTQKICSLEGKLLIINEKQEGFLFRRFMQKMPSDVVSICKAFFGRVTVTHRKYSDTCTPFSTLKI